jgi:ribosomal-protein-alanine N-acetyltransferase
LSTPFHIELMREDYAPLLLDYCIRNRAFLEPFEPQRDESYFTLEHQKEVARQSLLAYEKNIGFSFVMLDQDEDKLIGRVNLSNVSRGVFQNATIGYSIDAACSGKGWMTEAVRWVVRFAFSSLLLHRVQAGVMPHNVPSIRILEKIGFRREGYAERYLNINGQWRDHFIFATTLEEWEDDLL